MLQWFKSNLAWNDLIIKISFILALLLNFFTWYIVAIKAWPLKNIVPFFSLHYTVYTGVDWIGAWYIIFIYPLFGLVMLAVNFWLTSQVYSQERLYGYMLGLGTALMEILLLVFIIFLLSINIQAR